MLINDFNEYQERAKRTAGDQDNLDALANWAMGLAGESGEVCDFIKKIRFHGHPLDKDKLVDEMGDVMWYISQVADVMGIKMADLVETETKTIDGLQMDIEIDIRTHLGLDENNALAFLGLQLPVVAARVADRVLVVTFVHKQAIPGMTDVMRFDLARVLIVLAEIASQIGVDLSEVATVNIKKLEERYPNGFDTKHSINRIR